MQELQNTCPWKIYVPPSHFSFSWKISLQKVDFHTSSILREITSHPDIPPPSPMPTSGSSSLGRAFPTWINRQPLNNLAGTSVTMQNWCITKFGSTKGRAAMQWHWAQDKVLSASPSAPQGGCKPSLKEHDELQEVLFERTCLIFKQKEAVLHSPSHSC